MYPGVDDYLMLLAIKELGRELARGNKRETWREARRAARGKGRMVRCLGWAARWTGEVLVAVGTWLKTLPEPAARDVMTPRDGG